MMMHHLGAFVLREGERVANPSRRGLLAAPQDEVILSGAMLDLMVRSATTSNII
jgi:hypothetical protein